MTTPNYKEDVKVDIYSLHTEWGKQPELAVKYGDFYSDAISTREKQELIVERRKDELKEVAAQIDFDIRSDPKPFGFKAKPTDAAIKSAILIQKSYKDKQEEYYSEYQKLIELKEIENKLKGAYYSFQDRKAALESAGRLYLSGYYSDLKVEEEIGMKRRE